MNKLITYFIQGLLYIAPIGITAYVIYNILIFIYDNSQQLINALFGIEVPGLGVVAIVLFLILVGFLGKTIIAKPLKAIFRKILTKIPLLNFIHSALNDLFSAFVGKDKKFNKPVLVKINHESNLEKLGFVTEEDLSALGLNGKVAVYFPHSYNFSGELFIVDASSVSQLNIDSSKVMKFIVSAGVTGWK
ncbi:DUF502 domain-containing protein [Flavicella sediminum]|uniref:DUF502 domain-containing protein n=1 Tax=Flavicella sediminum TaxID=2585141 RepID=UPI00111D56AC|nr:DUF502 domain-containing protein [Flavicella sediminum]